MTHRELDNNSLFRLCAGDQVAMHWVQLGARYCHLADDQIDTPEKDPVAAARKACQLGALALELYTHPFFIKNMAALKYALLRNIHAYENSVAWEQSGTVWQSNYSDWARHGWIEVCTTVGDLCGGYGSTSAELPEMIAMAYANHHAIDGKRE